MTYSGELVRLRAFEPADVELFHAWHNDREVMRYMSPRYPFSRAVTAQRITESWATPTYEKAMLAVESLADGRLIGLAGLRDASPEVRDAELDLLLGDKAVWGQGYGTDTIRTLCRFGFEQMRLHRIHLWVFSGNTAAIRVYEKAGFTIEATARQSFAKEGERWDAHLMGLLEGELV